VEVMWTPGGGIPATANAVSFSSSGLSPNITYSYRLRSTNTAGSSGYSNTASAITLPR
jgi:phosphodiesterase/alkaline phosphatase D-like protein